MTRSRLRKGKTAKPASDLFDSPLPVRTTGTWRAISNHVNDKKGRPKTPFWVTQAAEKVGKLKVILVSAITTASAASTLAAATLEHLAHVEFERIAHHFFVLRSLFIGEYG